MAWPLMDRSVLTALRRSPRPSRPSRNATSGWKPSLRRRWRRRSDVRSKAAMNGRMVLAIAVVAGTALAALLARPAVSASPVGLSRGAPADGGFSAERLGRIDAIMQRAIDQGSVAGMVTLVARRG